MHENVVVDKRYGMIAEFEEAEELVKAAQAAREAGYKRMEGYSPFPVHGLSEAIGFKDNRVPWIIFLSGLVGGCFGFTMQYWISVIDLPLNVGGKPMNSIPSFVPITFECTILFGVLSAFLSVLALNLLPQPYHPIFNANGFERASQDRFFLCIESDDPLFDDEGTREFLEGLSPLTVSEVEK
ncbi:MAG TPA: DUF3341 domain-containing protein [Fimbriimonadaceae bacterium]|nr:DUF3341 domain-containing protein [Fimbriimonadaceae bacterium]